MYSQLKENYASIISDCTKLLEKNEAEWQPRYKGYIEKIGEGGTARSAIEEARKAFHIYEPLKVYLPIRQAKDASTKKVEFDLRFHGQSVGTLTVTNQNRSLHVKETSFCAPLLEALKDLPDEEDSWNGKRGRTFRAFYQDLERKNHDIGQKEHKLESYLLTNFSKHRAVEKELCNIQPIKMCEPDVKFQMPTPLKASTLHDDRVDVDDALYAKQDGGGIDILARTGSGKGTYLTVFELKDENLKSEPPAKAMRQAIAYTTFLHQLLRSPAVGGEEWWRFFGFNGDIPKKLTLRAVIAMPDSDDDATEEFKGYMQDKDNRRLPVGSGGDEIELHYYFRPKDNNEKPVTTL